MLANFGRGLRLSLNSFVGCPHLTGSVALFKEQLPEILVDMEAPILWNILDGDGIPETHAFPSETDEAVAAEDTIVSR